MDEKEQTSSLREKILKGGFFLLIRQTVGMLIGIIGIFLLTRLIGPENYGIYASVIGIFVFISNISIFGVNVYLIREKKEISDTTIHQAFTLLLMNGLLLASIGVFLALPLAQWLRNPSVMHPFLLLLATLPLNAFIQPSMAMMERDLKYNHVAIVELTGQLLFVLVSISLAWYKFEYWSPVIAYCVQQIVIAIGANFITRYRPKFTWSTKILKEMLSYGLGYSSSIWVWQLRTLVNPLLVGRFLGQDFVGMIALAIRLVETMSFVKSIAWRIAVSALARIQEDLEKLKNALHEAMFLQLFAIAPFLVVFSVVAKWIIPIVFGKEWLPLLQVFPYIAIGTMINSIFNMHSSVLYVFNKNWDVTIFHIAHITIFFLSSFTLLPFLGMYAYGFAELIAIFSYVVIHKKIAKYFTISYRNILVWLIGFVPILFFPFLSNGIYQLLIFFPLLILFSNTDRRNQILYYLRFVARRI